MPDPVMFKENPRTYALELMEEAGERDDTPTALLLLNCLNYMSHDDVRGMLEANDLAPPEDDEDKPDEDDDDDDDDDTIEVEMADPTCALCWSGEEPGHEH